MAKLRMYVDLTTHQAVDTPAGPYNAMHALMIEPTSHAIRKKTEVGAIQSFPTRSPIFFLVGDKSKHTQSVIDANLYARSRTSPVANPSVSSSIN